MTEGPYFVDEKLNRTDIRANSSGGAASAGVPLELTFNVARMGAGTCNALAGATVDVWQCDAVGVYSDVSDPMNGSSKGKNFLREHLVRQRIVEEQLRRELLHRAGCVVIPSLYEPFGIVALEAMAADAPTVVARTGSLAEIMDGTGAGLLFEPGNAVDLAESIGSVLTDPEMSTRLRRQAQDVLRSRYSWDAIAQATATVYGRCRRPSISGR